MYVLLAVHVAANHLSYCHPLVIESCCRLFVLLVLPRPTFRSIVFAAHVFSRHPFCNIFHCILSIPLESLAFSSVGVVSGPSAMVSAFVGPRETTNLFNDSF